MVRTWTAGTGRALTADGLTVTADMFCNEGFRADGEVRLPGANIGGQLHCSGAHLDGRDGHALDADRLTVSHDMFCDGLRTDGEVRLGGANIGGQLVFSGAHLDGGSGRALDAQGLTVTHEMFCDEGFCADGEVSLAGAMIGRLIDEKASWPKILILDGLTYGDMTYLTARDRLRWLKRSCDYRPQPYEQLAVYYRLLGHDEQARRVLLAKQRRRRRERSWLSVWGWLQDLIAGYGYAPGRSLVLLGAAFLVGWLTFRSHHPTPVGPGPHAEFNAALYTLDVLIPVSALGEANDWDPHGSALAVAAGLHILGWLLAITVIAAITRKFTGS